MASPRPRVFISYSHEDRDLLGLLLPHLKALERAGLLDMWVDTRIDAGERWYPEIEAAMQGAAVAVCLVSEYFLASDFCTKGEVPYLLKRAEEDGLLLIPVLLSDCMWQAHRWVEERQMLPGDGQSVRTHFANNPAAVFSRVAKRIHDKLKDPNYQPTKAHVAWPLLPPDRLDLTRLPETGAALFGRDQELQLLDAAWKSAEQDGSAPTRPTRIVAFTANGGVGKSTLVNHWLRDMQRDHFRGATRVFGWSFYSQGVREEGMASADIFIDAALRFFGDADPTAGSPWDKGERLARLVGAQRALLVLDGLEPLQSGHAFDRGTLRDPALHTLLRGLARRADGLCVVTTREPLPDLHGMAGVATYDLERISPEAGRALLRTARVVGSDTGLEELSKRFGLHALTVSMLGAYLHEKDPAHGTGPARALEQLPGATPIDRVLDGFEALLAGSAELEVLRLLSLFDRPADSGCLGALRVRPAIAGLTERVVRLKDAAWNGVLARLERLGLIKVLRKVVGESTPQVAIDAHPLLREHFAARILDKSAEAWREGHRRLYEYLKASVPYRPDSLDGLQPLYQAVAHGCRAGLHQEVSDTVYYDRILRRDAFYSTRKVGAFGSDLGAVACFFEQPWTRLSSHVSERDQAWLLNEAAFRLRALGRLAEAVEPMRTTLEASGSKGQWKDAAVAASNLSELELTLGQVTESLRDAAQALTFADRSGDAFQRIARRATLADVLHQAGRRREALERFREAEQMQAEVQPAYPLLYSVQGFRYCDLLLADAERAAWKRMLSLDHSPRTDRSALSACLSVSHRSTQMLNWGQEFDRASLLDRALIHLTLARSALYEVILDESTFPSSPNIQVAHRELAAALDGFRAAGQQDDLPRGLLARAWLRIVEGNPAGAHADLDEAWEIAQRGSMKLHMADVHLHRALIMRDRAEVGKAVILIEHCGYARRVGEVVQMFQAFGLLDEREAQRRVFDWGRRLLGIANFGLDTWLLDELIAAAKKTDNRAEAVHLFLERARMRSKARAYDQARWDYKMVVNLCREMDERPTLLEAEIELAELECKSGLFEDAYRHFVDAQSLISDRDNDRRVKQIRERVSELARFIMPTQDSGKTP